MDQQRDMTPRRGWAWRPEHEADLARTAEIAKLTVEQVHAWLDSQTIILPMRPQLVCSYTRGKLTREHRSWYGDPLVCEEWICPSKLADKLRAEV